MITTDFDILRNRRFAVCVVGSGIVGSCLAIDLASRGLSVLILESGLGKHDRKLQSLSDAIIASPQYHHPMSLAVSRSLGGTSALWGGRCVPLDEIDFVKRSFVSNSGWPITYDEVTRYERRAANLIGCDDGVFTTDSPTTFSGTEVDFNKLERWVNETRIVQQQPELKSSDRIMILLNATVVGLNVDSGAQVIKGIQVAREGQVKEFNGARDYVLALGGIETTRLLLNVQREHPQLFGGAAGALGRYYMGHISGSFADIRFYNPDQIGHFSNRKGEQSFARRRLTLSAEAQTKHQLSNVAFWPENAALSDPTHQSGFLSLIFLLLNAPKLSSRFIAEAIRKTQTSKRVNYSSHCKNLISDFSGAAFGALQVIEQRLFYGRRLPRFLVTNSSGVYPLRFHSEQTPNPANRIRLAPECDWLGMHRVAVEFTFPAPELARIKEAHRPLDRSLRNLGLGELIYHEALTDGDSRSEVMPDGLHQIGSVRMSANPANGVVNRDCRVYEFENLYVAGSSVFPTSGQASPTLPAVELAVRLSERLARPRETTKQHTSKTMNILFVSASYYPAVRYGGPTYTVHSLARMLAKNGNNVVVYTTNAGIDQIFDKSTTQTRVIDGVTVHYFPATIKKIYWSSSMIAALRENVGKFDIVHAQGAFLYPTVAARRAASRLGIPFIYSPRGMFVKALINRKNFLGKSAWIKCFENANCKSAAFLHATSDAEAQEIKRMGFHPQRIEVIPNGLDIPELESENEAEARRKRLIGHQRPYLIFLGRLSWIKGLDRLIQAMSFVRLLDLVIAGNDDENYTPKLMNLVRQQGLTDRVAFTGAVYGMDKFALLRGAELFVLPSYSESFGVVLLEALCCGCPVIMTPEVGIARDIEKSRAGVIVRGFPDEIGAAINSLLDDPDRRMRMSEIGKKVVADLYSWESIASKMQTAYRQALTANRCPTNTYAI